MATYPSKAPLAIHRMKMRASITWDKRASMATPLSGYYGMANDDQGPAMTTRKMYSVTSLGASQIPVNVNDSVPGCGLINVFKKLGEGAVFACLVAWKCQPCLRG